MAGFFERIANVWRGWLGLRVSQAEANNPEAVYESAIEERIKKHRELKKAVSGIVYLRNKLQAELDSMSVAEAIRAGPAPRFPPKRAFWLGSTARRRRLQEETCCEREQGGRGRGSAKIPRPRRGPGRRGRETGGHDAKSAQAHVAIVA